MRPAPSDTVPAMLTPGEAVLNKEAAELVGRDKIKQINKMGMHMRKAQGYADGDPNVQPKPAQPVAPPASNAFANQAGPNTWKTSTSGNGLQGSYYADRATQLGMMAPSSAPQAPKAISNPSVGPITEQPFGRDIRDREAVMKNASGTFGFRQMDNGDVVKFDSQGNQMKTLGNIGSTSNALYKPLGGDYASPGMTKPVETSLSTTTPVASKPAVFNPWDKPVTNPAQAPFMPALRPTTQEAATTNILDDYMKHMASLEGHANGTEMVQGYANGTNYTHPLLGEKGTPAAANFLGSVYNKWSEKSDTRGQGMKDYGPLGWAAADLGVYNPSAPKPAQQPVTPKTVTPKVTQDKPVHYLNDPDVSNADKMAYAQREWGGGMQQPAAPAAPAPQAEEQLTGNRVIPAGMRLTSYGAVTPINNPLAYEAERRMTERAQAAQMAPINALIQQAMNPSADDGTFTGMGRAKRQASGARAALGVLAGMHNTATSAASNAADRAANREVTMRGQDITAASAGDTNKRQLVSALMDRDYKQQMLGLLGSKQGLELTKWLAAQQAQADEVDRQQSQAGSVADVVAEDNAPWFGEMSPKAAALVNAYRLDDKALQTYNMANRKR